MVLPCSFLQHVSLNLPTFSRGSGFSLASFGCLGAPTTFSDYKCSEHAHIYSNKMPSSGE